MRVPLEGETFRFTEDQTAVYLRHKSMSRQQIWAVPAEYFRKTKPELVDTDTQSIFITKFENMGVVFREFTSKGWKIIAERSSDRVRFGFYCRLSVSQPEQYIEVT